MRPQRGRLERTRPRCQGGARSQSPPGGQSLESGCARSVGSSVDRVEAGSVRRAEPACGGAGPAPGVATRTAPQGHAAACGVQAAVPVYKRPRGVGKDARCPPWRPDPREPPAWGKSCGPPSPAVSGCSERCPLAPPFRRGAAREPSPPARTPAVLAGAHCGSRGHHSCFCGAEPQSSRS